MAHGNCADRERLRRELAEATVRYVAQVNRTMAAAAQPQPGAFVEAINREEEARILRHRASKAFLAHCEEHAC